MTLKIFNSSDLPVIDYRYLIPMQGNLKDLNDKNFEKLKSSFQKFGFRVPFFVWFPNKNESVLVSSGEAVEVIKGQPYIIDGHQRQRVLKQIDAQPYLLPYIQVHAENYKEAKRILLTVTSQYGSMTYDGLDEFTFDLESDFVMNFTMFDGLPLLYNEDDESEEKETKDKPVKTIFEVVCIDYDSAEPFIKLADENGMKYTIKTK